MTFHKYLLLEQTGPRNVVTIRPPPSGTMRLLDPVVSSGPVMLALAGCMSSTPIHPQGAATVLGAELSIVESPWVEAISREGQLVYSPSRDTHFWAPTEIQLGPGAYTITYHVPASNGFPEATREDQIDVKPGHRYRADTSSCPWWGPRHGCSLAWAWVFKANCYARFLWFEDVTVGQVIAGSKSVPAAPIDPPSTCDGVPLSAHH